jgi:hypothetical protein
MSLGPKVKVLVVMSSSRLVLSSQWCFGPDSSSDHGDRLLGPKAKS